MDLSALRDWLVQPRTDLSAAVSAGIQAHVAKLRARGVDFYGYALLPGEPYDIGSLVAVVNCEADIKPSSTDAQYRYYRFGVDEWAHWDHNEFAVANALLAQLNERFASMHSKRDGDYSMDEFEIAHADGLFEAIVRGLEIAKAENVFGTTERFLAVWISDSDHPIIGHSVRRLNSSSVTREFMAEFGLA